MEEVEKDLRTCFDCVGSIYEDGVDLGLDSHWVVACEGGFGAGGEGVNCGAVQA